MAEKIVIFSTKGGVGKTIIATNLAVSLAKSEFKRVCAVDLDTHVAQDMSRLLNLKPQKALVDLVYLLKTHPANFKKEDFLLQSPSLNVDFLAGVLKPQQAPHIEPDKLKEVFDILDQYYDFIIVDAGKSFSDLFVNTLNLANLILLVVTPDILSIYQTEWALDTLQSMQFPLAMVKVVLNRAESAASISLQEVKSSLPVEIIAKIPSEGKLVGDSVNLRIPVVMDKPKAKITLAINAFARKLVTDKDLYIKHRDIDRMHLKDMALEGTGDFWQSQGLVVPLAPMQEQEELDEILLLKRRIHNRLIQELNLKRLDLKAFVDPQKARELREKADLMVSDFLVEEAGSFITSQEIRKKLVKEILDEALGLGPLEDLLADPTITDIMVNNRDEIYIERNGKIEFTSKKFISNEQVKTVIERIIAPIGRRIDESVPMVDARLADGSRVNAIIPPLSLTGPSLTIRKFRKERFTIEDLVNLNSIATPMAEFLKACVLSRKNIIVSGGTGSGKTTFLNVLSAFIPESDRIVTIEDAAELKLRQEHWVRLESRPPNIEGRGAVTIRDLFRNTLRMRPDRIIIGECRGIETLDMLQAMNTGHDGSMTTVHANSTHDVLSRLDSMILMSGIELPIRAIREMIASAINLVVHTARLSDGTRKVVQISEVYGMKDELHIDLKDVFIFRQLGIDSKGGVLGDYVASGYVPSFLDEIKTKGIALSEDVFKTS